MKFKGIMLPICNCDQISVFISFLLAKEFQLIGI